MATVQQAYPHLIFDNGKEMKKLLKPGSRNSDPNHGNSKTWKRYSGRRKMRKGIL